MRSRRFVPILTVLCVVVVFAQSPAPAGRWPEAKAAQWYAAQPWLVGSNYIPATAINELEMWQADTFDPSTIDKELGWAEGLGMTTMRVFLHDLPWQQDADGYRQRIDRFLSIATRHHIKPLFVLFDSCWDPNPRLGPQRAPTPGVHNSGWLQSPGARALQDPAEYPRLRAYVVGVTRAFGKDARVLGWDVWKGDWSADEKLSPTERIQLDESDVISFHNYDNGQEFQKRIMWLQRYRRPILCTEYMARGNGSTFQGSLPIAREHNVAAINWGFVAGKTQTYLPWDSWQKPYVGREPSIWFHEIFKQDGTPYRQDEVELIKTLTHSAMPAVAGRP